MLKITFQLFEQDAAAFDRFAEGCGGRSALVRWLVGELISGRLQPPLSDETAVVSPTRHNLVELPRARGMTRSKWIHALVRCRLGAPNAFAKSDRIILRHTTQSLKTLTADVRRLCVEWKVSKVAETNTARLTAIEESIEGLARTIRTAVDGSELYWRSATDARATDQPKTSDASLD